MPERPRRARRRQVTVIEAAPRLLPATDPEASRVVAEVFGAEGIGVRTGASAASVRQDDKEVTLALASGEEVTADRLLVATGRHPVTGNLGAEAAGARLDQRGYLVTGRHLATTVRGIYAAGDVTGRMPFTPAAFATGRLAARNTLRPRWSPPSTFATPTIPWVVFTDPEVGTDPRARPGQAHRHVHRPARPGHSRLPTWSLAIQQAAAQFAGEFGGRTAREART